MHNAPSVSYPVGRCAFQLGLLLGFAVLTSTVLTAWALNHGLSWLWLSGLGAAVVGLWQGRRALDQAGVLTWAVDTWYLHDQGPGSEDVFGEVQVALDLQIALLLRWQPASDTLRAKPQWLWLEGQHCDECWQDLRRAVYQRSDVR